MPVEGRGLSSGRTQQVVRDREIGQPNNSETCSEAADGVTRVWFESISLQQRVRRNRWLGNARGAGTMLHGAPTVHLGIKYFQGPAAGVGCNVFATSLSESGLGDDMAR